MVRPLRSRLIAYLYARARCRNLVVSRVRIILHAIPAGHIHVRAVGPHAVLVIAYAHHRTVTPVRLPVRVIPVDRPVLVACLPYREPHTLHARWRSDVVRHQLERSAVRVVRPYRRLHRRVAYRELLGLHAHLASVHQGYVGVRIVLPRLPVVPDADVGLPRAGSPLLRRVPSQVVLAVLGSPDCHRHTRHLFWRIVYINNCFCFFFIRG